MNKTKRTLFISSLVMVLTLIVAIVSVSAAWFGNTANVSKDGFVIDSDTLQEFASIEIDSDLTAEGGEKLWPAIAKKGELLKNGIVAPIGKTLKAANGVVQRGAKCATVYFPVTFMGAGDEGYTDQRKSLKLSVESATIAKYVVKDSDDKIVSFTNFKNDFNVELDMVSITKAEGQVPTVTLISMDGVDAGNLTGNQIFYVQPYENGEPTYNLYMLLQPGISYYVRATIYFNHIDEECNPELLYETISFNFSMSILKPDADNWVNIRKMYKL